MSGHEFLSGKADWNWGDYENGYHASNLKKLNEILPKNTSLPFSNIEIYCEPQKYHFNFSTIGHINYNGVLDNSIIKDMRTRYENDKMSVWFAHRSYGNGDLIPIEKMAALKPKVEILLDICHDHMSDSGLIQYQDEYYIEDLAHYSNSVNINDDTGSAPSGEQNNNFKMTM